MDYLDLLYYLSSMIIIGGVFLSCMILNIIVSFIVKKLTKKKFKKTNSVEDTMYTYNLLTRYIKRPILFLTIMINSFVLVISDIFYFAEPYELVFIILIALFVSFIDLAIGMWIMHNYISQLRGTKETLKDQIKQTLYIYLIMMIIVGVIVSAIIALPSSLGMGWFDKYIKATIAIALYLIGGSCLEPLYKKILKSYPMEDNELKRELVNFLNDIGLSNVEIYIWETRAKKHANALVSGLKKNKIFITDYLLEEFDIDEVKGILAHEAGHIVKKHIKIRLFLIIGAIYLYPILLDVLNLFEDRVDLFVGLVLHIGFIWGGYFLYLTLVKLHIFRKQEMQADSYVLECGVDPLVYISALQKLSSLNHMVSKFNKVDEKMMTHPSTQIRIDKILDLNNLKVENQA